MHHSKIHKEKIQQDATIYQNFIIPCLYEAQHVSGDTPPIIRSLKLHWQPLVFIRGRFFVRIVGGRCQAHTVPDNVHVQVASFHQGWNTVCPKCGFHTYSQSLKRIGGIVLVLG